MQGLIDKKIISNSDWIFDIIKPPSVPYVCIMEDYMMKIINTNLSSKAEILHTYLFILKHIIANFKSNANKNNNWCYFDIEDVCNVVGISESTAKRYIKELKQLGVIISDNIGVVKTGDKIHQDKSYYALPEHKRFLEFALELRLKEINKNKNTKLLTKENIKPFDGLVEKYKKKSGGKNIDV